MQKQISLTSRQQYAKLVVALTPLILLSLLFIPFFTRSQANNTLLNTQLKTVVVEAQPAVINEQYTLIASYYSLRNNLTATLMLNNKGALPLTVTPTFFNLNGTRLELAPLTVNAASYREIDLRELLANAGDEFREGSLQVLYQGKKMQLGSQIKLFDSANSLLFEEQMFVPAMKHISSRLESVWWLPTPNCDTKFVLSNTTDAPVTATVKVDGTTPQQQEPVSVQLNSHQTRVLDLVGNPGAVLQNEGGISISHSGAPGAVLARMLVSRPNKGFSSVVNFVDPEMTASSKWHGAGLRLGRFGGEQLNQILVARNASDQPTTVSGRIPYTNQNGNVVSVTVPQVNIAPRATKIVNLREILESANVPASVNFAGLEFDYSTARGSVVMTAFSVSQNENHIFQVPLFDPQKTPSSAGGFPFKADGDYSTIVYLKNDTNQTKKYIASVTYEGGAYSLGVREIKGKQTVAIDFRSLRDNQTPDTTGQRIPLNIERGQIAWSVKGRDNYTINSRSEQVSLQQGVSSTYDCRNCCPNNFFDGWVTPGEVSGFVGDVTNFSALQRDTNCYGQLFPPRSADIVNWESTDPSVASCNYFNGQTTALSSGETQIQGHWTADSWFDDGSERCDYTPIDVLEEAFCMILPPCAYPTNFQQVGNGVDIGGGALRFNYSWGSSTGNLADLSQCTVGEIVTYPGTGNYFPPSPPFPTTGFPNPTIIDLPATDGGFQDTHSTRGTFVTPYSSSSFTATQNYRYKCPCRSSGNYVNLVGPINIVRAVSPSTGGRWKFTITKSGASATIDPLP